MEKGDTVVVCRLDRLGRSLPNLLNLVEDLTAHSVGPAVPRSAMSPMPPLRATNGPISTPGSEPILMPSHQSSFLHSILKGART